MTKMLIRNIYYFYLALKKKYCVLTFHRHPSPLPRTQSYAFSRTPLPPLVHTYYVNGPIQRVVFPIEKVVKTVLLGEFVFVVAFSSNFFVNDIEMVRSF